MNNVVLIGFRGVGKSTVGKALAEKLSRSFTDLDTEIEKKTNLNPVDFVAANGEEEFRRIESECLAEFFESHDADSILACGGGIVESKNSRDILTRQTGFVVHLFCPVEVAEERLLKDKDNPRIGGLLGSDELKQLWTDRTQIFDRIADYNVDASRSVDEIVNEISEIIERKDP